MRAFSLWQPWSSLVSIGAKQYETRSWSTKHRGDLVIHAAKRWTWEEKQLLDHPAFKSALLQGGVDLSRIPLGVGLCVVELVDVIPTHRIRHLLSRQEREFGNYSDGRFAWKLANVRPFDVPIPARGEQGLFDWTYGLPEGSLP